MSVYSKLIYLIARYRTENRLFNFCNKIKKRLVTSYFGEKTYKKILVLIVSPFLRNMLVFLRTENHCVVYAYTQYTEIYCYDATVILASGYRIFF